MDNLTHSLFALTLAQTPLRRAGRGTTLTLLLASNAPDSDVVVAAARGGAAYLSVHRGSSHGPLGVIALALLAAAVVSGSYWCLDRRLRLAAPWAAMRQRFIRFAGVALIGTLLHVLMDFPTAYGTRALSPFDDTWYSVDWMPIIDGYLLAILGLGLVAVGLRPNARGKIAAAILLLVTANYALRAGLHAAALREADQGQTMPAMLSAWPDLPSPKLPDEYACPENPCDLITAALPTFGSPFRWRIVRQFSNGYNLSDLDVLTRTERAVARITHQTGSAVRTARAAAEAEALLRFSRFPAADVFDSDGATVVRIRDVRFMDAPLGRRGEQFRRRRLFVAMVRLDSHGAILDSRFGN